LKMGRATSSRPTIRITMFLRGGTA
jgi:hypothetical protein